jgi:hypothetical protein
MLVCDVSAIDRLIDMYGENLSVFYKDQKYSLYDLRYEFVDNNIQCSLDTFKVSSSGIHNLSEQLIISINTIQNINRDDISL